MLLLYSDTITPRLQYVSRFIFGEIMSLSCKLTTDKQEFNAFDGPRINYSNDDIRPDHSMVFTIRPQGLLQETGIRQQEVVCKKDEKGIYFFIARSGDHHFDILSAVFYLISRYEEYLVKERDEYGRFPHYASVAYKEKFMDLPLVNIWLNHFSEKLRNHFPGIQISLPSFRFLPTYDIDIAYSFKGKGFLRNMAGIVRSFSLERLAVLSGKKQDPFDSYAWLDEMHEPSNLRPLFFFLVAAGTGKYDKNIRRESPEMLGLIKKYAGLIDIGIHPSWKSNENTGILEEEKNFLESCAQKKITTSRQHYIKMNLPDTYRNLLHTGIQDDHSMGYGSINGFRASVANAFNWYDLEKETETSLRVHPFCFMEANCYYELRQSPEESLKELMHYYDICREWNGTLITIFHNNFLGTAQEFRGWKEMYGEFISQIRQ